MKIGVCCNWQKKFLGVMVDWWEANGHEINYSVGYDPDIHASSDIYFIDVCDNNAIVGSKNRFPDVPLVIRAIDIECWVGQPGAVTWENVNAVIFGAKHIQELVESYVPFANYQTKRAHIPFGVNLNQWTFKERRAPISKKIDIAIVAHRWSAKGIPLALQVANYLYNPVLHFLGTPSNEKWLHYYIDHMIDLLALEVTFTTRVDNVDEWLEPMDFALISSQKEAFSYAAAEAAAKGIKPLIHAFPGSDRIWPHSWLWLSASACAQEIKLGDYNSSDYRKYIQDHFDINVIMTQYMELFSTL